MNPENLFTEKRPWGEFRQFVKNEKVTVKIIKVNAGEVTSLQYHNKRHEFWYILEGNGEVTIGEKIIAVKGGDEFNVPKKTLHRLSAGTDDLLLLEINSGDFDENDIVRLKDKYGRA